MTIALNILYVPYNTETMNNMSHIQIKIQQ